MAKEFFMTQEGRDNLEARLHYLKTDRQKEVSEALRIAREHGDLSENAEYDAAKDAASALETEIGEIEEQLNNAVIIEGKKKKNVVQIGSFVKLYDMKWDEMLEYTIVGSLEADIHQNKISNESAVAKAIIGRKKGEICDVTAPNGDVYQVEIKDVK